MNMYDLQLSAESLKIQNSLFRIQDLSFCYNNGPLALNDINLDIAAGERIALVGQNGSGKSTLIKQLCGLLLPDDGQVLYKGQPLRSDHLEQSHLEIGLLFQDPDDQLFGHTLIDDVAFGPFYQGKPYDLARQVARQSLEHVHLENKAYKPPHHLSFGQKKRAALAGLLAMQPKVLLLDEPTANLDPRQEQVFFDLLTSFDGTLICISHDLIFLYELCDRAVVLDHGHIAYDSAIRDLVVQRNKLRSYGLDFSFRLVEADNGKIEDAKLTCPPQARVSYVASNDCPIVELRDYDFYYPDGTRALEGINFCMSDGDRLAVVGENGAGKTTLLSCLVGLKQGKGSYFFEDKMVTRRSRRDLWQKIALVFQNSADQLFCPTVAEELSFGLQQLGYSRSEICRRTHEALAMVHLEGFETRVPLHMSGGERKRLSLACALSMSPKLLILDEPTAGLDPYGEELLLSILSNLDITLILVSHDIFFIQALTCRTIILHQGSILQDLQTCSFITDSRFGMLNGLAYAFRQNGSEAIRQACYKHNYSHPDFDKDPDLHQYNFNT